MVDTEDPRDEMSFLVSITGKMVPICGQALAKATISESDNAIAALIIKYATEIDNGNLATLAKFGPLLLQAMEALQMSPRSRAHASKGAPTNVQPQPASRLDELRERRLRNRKNGTKVIHSSTS